MSYVVNAKSRTLEGTGASRRLRKAGGLPGVIYGANKEAISIEFEHNPMYHLLQEEAFHSSIIDLNLEGEKQSVLLRDVQYHPWRQLVLHVDFQRISADQIIHMRVPLHFLNEENAPGVKLHGGVVHKIANEVEVACLPNALPEYIEVDLGALEMGQTLHLSDLTLAKGLELPAVVRGEDLALASITAPKSSKSDDTESTAATGSQA